MADDDARSRERLTVGEGRIDFSAPLEPGAEEPGDNVLAVPGTPSEPGRLALSTAVFAFATGLSRIAGLVREVVAASYFGVKGPMSAFTIAFQVPNLVRNLFADSALQAAFVPVFTEQLERKGPQEAFRVASALVFVIAVVLGSLTALFVLLAPVLMPLFAPGFDQNLTDLTVRLSQILFPIVLLLGFSGLVVGVLNSFDEFGVPAIAPLAWNVAIILTLVLLTPVFHGQDRIYAYAIGVLIGTLIQLLLPLPWLRRTGFRIVRSFDWRDERVIRVLKLMMPVTLGLGLINFNLSVDSIFATLISDQAPAAIDKAFRIYMLPQGVFAVALATVIFPRLSRLVARDDHATLRETLSHGMRQMFFLLVPTAAAFLVLSDPITQVVYQRGQFDAAQTDLVSEALFYFALSLPFAGVNLILIRTFFSLQRPWTPTLIALGNLGVNAALDALLYKPIGVGGIALSTGAVSLVTTVALMAVLRRLIGGVDARRTLAVSLRITIAAAVLAIATLVVKEVLDGALSGSNGAQLIVVVVAGSAGMLAYAAASAALRIDEAREVAALVKGQLRRLR
jgi:putative peptidoglycan lipid II flippase